MSMITALRSKDARLLARRPVRNGSAQLVAGLVLISIVALLIAISYLVRETVFEQNLSDRLMPPMWAEGGSAAHVLGTDSLGRDVAARISYGLRTSMVIALSAVAIGGGVGIVVGLVSGYAGGWIDAAFMRIADAVLAIPTILFALAVIAIIGGGTVNLIAVIAFAQWMAFARNTRAETLVQRQMLYSTAARSLGANGGWIVLRHILPHTVPSTIVLATLGVSSAILTEAGLSFLGVGVQPPLPSLGGMLSEGRQYITAAPWLAVFPGLAIFAAVFGVNMLGEGIRARLAARSAR